MVQKYQNEIPPIFYYGISTKTSEKDLKIPNLQALTLGRIIKITLYMRIYFMWGITNYEHNIAFPKSAKLAEKGHIRQVYI